MSANHQFPDSLVMARHLRARGERVINYPRGTKAPTEKGWPLLDIYGEELEARFKSHPNIGLILTERRADVDFDDITTVRLAHKFPSTGWLIGRNSKPISHSFYEITGNVPRFKRFKDHDGKTLLELRTAIGADGEPTGAQTMFAPSIHPDKEPIELVQFTEPAEVDGDTLKAVAHWVAAAALVARHWPNGQRADAAMALSGVLFRAGWTEDKVSEFVADVCHAAQDEEADKRLGNVHRTAERLAKGDKNTTGLPRLKELIGGQAVKLMVEWLGLTCSEPSVEATPWPRPQLFDQAQQTPAIPCNVLPGVYGEFAQSLSDALKVPRGVVVLAILGVLSICSNRAWLKVSPKQGWEMVVLLYLMSLLPPSASKSPVFAAVMKPVEDWQENEKWFNGPSIEKNNKQRAAIEREIEALRAKGAKELATGKPATSFNQADTLELQMDQNYPLKVLSRLLTKDTTNEALADFMEEQKGVGAVVSTENIFRTLGGLYNSGGSANTSLLMDGYDGALYTRDRVSAKKREPFRARLTISVSVQLPVLREMAANTNWKGCGLVERITYLIPTEQFPLRDFYDTPVPQPLSDAYAAGVKQLLSLPPTLTGAPVLTLSPEAETLFATVYGLIEKAKLPGGMFQDWPEYAGKFAGTVARIAGLLHLAEHQLTTTVISRHTLARAVRLCRRLAEHALVAHEEMSMGPVREDVKALVAKLIAGTLRDVGPKPETITRTDISNAFGGRRDPAVLDAMTRVLEDRGIIRAVPAEKGTPGKPTTKFFVNPHLFDQE